MSKRKTVYDKLGVKRQPARKSQRRRMPARPKVQNILEYSEVSIEEFLNDEPRLAKFLSIVKIGSHPHTAAAAVMLNPNILSRWVDAGIEPMGDEGCRRLVILLRAAIAEPSQIAENSVLNKSPQHWLASSTRAVLSPQSSASPADPSLPSTDEQSNLPRTPISLSDLAAALVELSRAGVGLPAPVPTYSSAHSRSAEDRPTAPPALTLDHRPVHPSTD